MDCPLQTVHLCLLKRILGIKRTTPSWSVLRNLYKFIGSAQLGLTMLCCAAIALCSARSCIFGMGLDRCNTFTHCVWSRQPITIREFVVDSKIRQRGVWNADALAEHSEHTNKLPKYHH
eukprot:1161986-Pelagomonas_calceolata.AAC.6